MHKKFAVLAASMFAFAGAAQATDLNYNYLDIGYTVTDIDDISVDVKSYGIAGSFLVSNEIFVYGGYMDGQTDRFFGGRIDISGYTLGLGYRLGISPQTDFNFGAAFERARLKGTGAHAGLGSESDNGYSLSVGVRHLFAPQFEFGAAVTYVDVFDDDDTVLSVGGLWHINEVVAVGLAYGVGSDASSYTGSVRFKF